MTLKTCQQDKNPLVLMGGLRGGSSVRRPGSEDPHRRQQNLLHISYFMVLDVIVLWSLRSIKDLNAAAVSSITNVVYRSGILTLRDPDMKDIELLNSSNFCSIFGQNRAKSTPINMK